jgi:hypothetical protein
MICTHRSKEFVHVFGVGVDDQLVDLLLPDFAQHLAVRGWVGLPDVHLGALRGWTLDQVLQLEQTCKHHGLLRTPKTTSCSLNLKRPHRTLSLVIGIYF